MATKAHGPKATTSATPHAARASSAHTSGIKRVKTHLPLSDGTWSGSGSGIMPPRASHAILAPLRPGFIRAPCFCEAVLLQTGTLRLGHALRPPPCLATYVTRYIRDNERENEKVCMSVCEIQDSLLHCHVGVRLRLAVRQRD